nr:MAG TPA: hypothetical protein [Caudoviricetes sp.]
MPRSTIRPFNLFVLIMNLTPFFCRIIATC